MMLSGLAMGFLLAWLFVLGAVIGSFLNVCIYRIPQHTKFPARPGPFGGWFDWVGLMMTQLKSLWHPPSTCPQCHNRLLFRDNIPIIGWLKLRGRCRFCSGKISFRYPFIEFLNGALFVLIYMCEIKAGTYGTLAIKNCCVYFEYGPQIIQDGLTPFAWLHWRYAYHMILIEALLVATMIDFDTQTIPDASTVPAMAVGFIMSTIVGQVFLVPVWFQSPSIQNILQLNVPEWMHWSTVAYPAWITTSPHMHGLAHSLAGFLVGGGIVWVVRIIGAWILKREAMGFGDVILMAMIGSFLGWQATTMVFFIAPICALAVVIVMFVLRRSSQEIPYGPYLSLAALLLIVFWKELWPLGERVFHFGPLVFVMAILMPLSMIVTLGIMQRIKRLLGIPLYEDEWIESWTSADQLAFYADSSDHSGNWPRDRWQGESAARGSVFESQWRSED